MLLCALTWPATWLERRGLTCPPAHYRRLIEERLAAIAAHGEPTRYEGFFPRYLLKALQDFFERHGDDLYGDLKHIRNALDQVLASARFAERVRDDARQLDVPSRARFPSAFTTSAVIVVIATAYQLSAQSTTGSPDGRLRFKPLATRIDVKACRGLVRHGPAYGFPVVVVDCGRSDGTTSCNGSYSRFREPDGLAKYFTLKTALSW